MKKSTKTTLAGIIACLGLLFTASNPWFDGNPETVPNVEELGVAVAALGAILTGVFARDDDVSSAGGVASKNKKPVKKK